VDERLRARAVSPINDTPPVHLDLPGIPAVISPGIYLHALV